MKHGTHKIWTERDEAYLRKHYPAGRSIQAIANHLGVSPQRVYTKARYLFLWRNNGEAWNKIKWSKKDIAFIRKNFHSMNNRQIAKALGRKLTVIRNKCRELGLLHMKLEYWTPDQVEFLKANYKTKGNSELAQIFQERWPGIKPWTIKRIEKKKGYLGLNRTIAEQFMIRTHRFNPNDYKDFNGKNFPQGKRRLWISNGKYRWMIKVGNSFQPLHRYKWEKLRGPIPRGYKVVFLDGNTTNCRINNLACMTKAQLAGRVARKNHSELSDSYIAGILSWRDPELKKEILNRPELLQIKRQQILTQRALGKSRMQPITKNTKQNAYTKANS